MSGSAHPFMDASGPRLVDVVDRLLDRGVVISGDLRLSVADVDLLFVGLRVIASSVDTIDAARQPKSKREAIAP